MAMNFCFSSTSINTGMSKVHRKKNAAENDSISLTGELIRSQERLP